MVVEFTASTCTFCGGAVGTALSQARGTEYETEWRRDERSKEPLHCHSLVSK